MRKTIQAVLAIGLLVVFATSEARAGSVLYEDGFHVDGSFYEPFQGDSLPSEFDDSSFDDTTGLGTITWQLTGGGDHTVIAYFDHEIEEATNTFYNEYGDAVNSPATGQTWEIDEPGWSFGDLYWNAMDGTLDGTNGVPAGSEDDVAMALGWDFYLDTDETAVITWVLSQNAPTTSGLFYLLQHDITSQETIYFYSTLAITAPPGNLVPLPSAALLALPGLVLLAGVRRMRRRR